MHTLSKYVTTPAHISTNIQWTIQTLQSIKIYVRFYRVRQYLPSTADMVQDKNNHSLKGTVTLSEDSQPW